MRPLVTLLLALAFATAAQAVPIDVQGVRLEIPIPKGFGDPSRAMPVARTLAETLTPAGNRLQLVFLSDADLKLAKAGGEAQWDRYLMVQTTMKIESVNVSDSEFEKFRNVFAQRQAVLLEENKEAIQRQLVGASEKYSQAAGGPAFSLTLGQTIPLGVFANTRNGFAYGSLVKYSVQISGQTVEQPMVAAMAAANIRHKMIFLNAYSMYRTQKDIDDVKRTVESWLAAVEAANR